MNELTAPKSADANSDAMFPTLKQVDASVEPQDKASLVSFPRQPGPQAKTSTPVPEPPKAPTSPRSEDSATAGRNPLFVPLLLVIGIACVQAILLIWGIRDRAAGSASRSGATGTVVVESTPPGATIAVDGKMMGRTPATLTLGTGKHTIELASGNLIQRAPLVVQAGISGAERFHFAQTNPNASLQVSSQPSGARVSVDGSAQGVTPVTIADLRPGSHAVLIEGSSGSSRETVTLVGGSTSSLTVTLPTSPANAAGGWLSISAPIDVQLFENGALLGSSQTERIMLPAGRHVIETTNTTLGYQTTQTVQVGVGTVTRLSLEMPATSLSVNALPWADVSIDGKSFGVTPLGNVSVPIGTHEIVFRHPQLGERRRTAVVTLKGPNRISENLNQK